MATNLLAVCFVVAVTCVAHAQSAAIRDDDVGSQQSSDYWTGSKYVVTTTDHPDHSDNDACQTILPSYAGGVDILRPSDYIFPPPKVQHGPAYYYSLFLQRSIFFYNWWAPFDYEDRSDWPDKSLHTPTVVSSDSGTMFATTFVSRSFSDPNSETYTTIQIDSLSSWKSTPMLFSSMYSTVSFEDSAADKSYSQESYQKTPATAHPSTEGFPPTTVLESSRRSSNIWDTSHYFAVSTTDTVSISTTNITGSLTATDHTLDTHIAVSDTRSDLSHQPYYSISSVSDTLDESVDKQKTQMTTYSNIAETTHSVETSGRTMYQSNEQETFDTSLSVAGTKSDGFTGVGEETTPFSGKQHTTSYSNLLSEGHNSDGYRKSHSSILWSVSEKILPTTVSYEYVSFTSMTSTTTDYLIAPSIKSSYSTVEIINTDVRSTTPADQRTLSWTLETDSSTSRIKPTVPSSASYSPMKSQAPTENRQFSSTMSQTVSATMDITGLPSDSQDMTKHISDLNTTYHSYIEPTTVSSSNDLSGASTGTVPISGSEMMYTQSFTTGHGLSDTEETNVHTTLFERPRQTSESTSGLNSFYNSSDPWGTTSSFKSSYEPELMVSYRQTDAKMTYTTIPLSKSLEMQTSDDNTQSRASVSLVMPSHLSDSLLSRGLDNSTSRPSKSIGTPDVTFMTADMTSVVPSFSVNSISGGSNNPSDTVISDTEQLIQSAAGTEWFSVPSHSFYHAESYQTDTDSQNTMLSSLVPTRKYSSDIDQPLASSLAPGVLVTHSSIWGSDTADSHYSTTVSTRLDFSSVDESQVVRPTSEGTLRKTTITVTSAHTFLVTDTSSLVESDNMETTTFSPTGTLPSLPNSIIGTYSVYSGLINFATQSTTSDSIKDGSLNLGSSASTQSFDTLYESSLFLSQIHQTDKSPASSAISIPSTQATPTIRNSISSSDSTDSTLISGMPSEIIDSSTRHVPDGFSSSAETPSLAPYSASGIMDSRSYSYSSLYPSFSLLPSLLSSLSSPSSFSSSPSSPYPASTFSSQIPPSWTLDTKTTSDVPFQTSTSTIDKQNHTDATDSITRELYSSTPISTTGVHSSTPSLTHSLQVKTTAFPESLVHVPTVDHISRSIHVSATPTPLESFTRTLSDSTIRASTEGLASNSVTVSTGSTTLTFPESIDGTETGALNPSISSTSISSNGVFTTASESGPVFASSTSPWVVTSSQTLTFTHTLPETTTEQTAGGADNQSGSDSGGPNIAMIAGGAAAATVVLGALAGLAIYFKVKAASSVGSLPGAANYNSPSVPNQANYNDPPRQPDNNRIQRHRNDQRNRSNDANGPNADRGTQDGPGNSKVKLPKNIKPSQISPMQNPPQGPPQPNNGLWLNNEPLPSISGQFPGGDASVPAMGSYNAPSVPGAANYSNPLASLHGPLPGGGSGVPGSGSYITPSIPGPASY